MAIEFASPKASWWLEMKSEILDRLEAVMSETSDDFDSLVKASGLKPAQDFRNVDLSGVDFGSADLTEYSFDGSKLDGADLSSATLGRRTLVGASLLNAKLPPTSSGELFEDREEIDIPCDASLGHWNGPGRGSIVLRQFIGHFLRLPTNKQIAIIDEFMSQRYSPSNAFLDLEATSLLRYSSLGVDPEVIRRVREMGTKFPRMIANIATRADLRHNFSPRMADTFFNDYISL